MLASSALSDRTKVAVLADEATVNGFKLTGINGSDWTSQSAHGFFHYFHTVIDNEDDNDIVEKYTILIQRKEIAIIFIGHKAARVLKEEIGKRREMFPIIMEIPSKNAKPTGEEEKLMKRLKEITGEK